MHKPVHAQICSQPRIIICSFAVVYCKNALTIKALSPFFDKGFYYYLQKCLNNYILLNIVDASGGSAGGPQWAIAPPPLFNL